MHFPPCPSKNKQGGLPSQHFYINHLLYLQILHSFTLIFKILLVISLKLSKTFTKTQFILSIFVFEKAITKREIPWELNRQINITKIKPLRINTLNTASLKCLKLYCPYVTLTALRRSYKYVEQIFLLTFNPTQN